jgi:hypothetical protein
MPKKVCYEDLTGKKFGKLNVLEFSHKVKKVRYWKCKCDCGNEKVINGFHLKRGKINSCGCLIKEATRKMGLANKTHGLKHNILYKLWGSIKSRCNNENTENYKMYGARGIKMCEEWSNDPLAFYNWAMNNGYKKGLQIDRIDNYKGYSPDNCRFVTCKENCNNKRNNAKIEKRNCINCDGVFNYKLFNYKKPTRFLGLFCCQNCRYEFYRKKGFNPNTPIEKVLNEDEKCKLQTIICKKESIGK